MPTAGSANLGTSTTTLFAATGTNGGGVTVIQVTACATNTATALVNVPGLHLSSEWLPMEAGMSLAFRNAVNAIHTVYAKSDATSGATVYFGVSAKL
jgi:hypothetical protein